MHQRTCKLKWAKIEKEIILFQFSVWMAWDSNPELVRWSRSFFSCCNRGKRP